MTKNKRGGAAQKKHLVAPGELDVKMPLVEMLEGRQNRYLLVNLLARRARELNRGEPTLVNPQQPHTFTQLALSEMEQDKLVLQRKATSKVLVNLIESE
jgi:DNA-directed RNA polymerase omega subunit